VHAEIARIVLRVRSGLCSSGTVPSGVTSLGDGKFNSSRTWQLAFAAKEVGPLRRRISQTPTETLCGIRVLG
jgi:hypothetical protein